VPPTRESVELGEQFRKARLAAVTVEVLRAALPDRTALVVEDSHLMDDASADVVAQLVDDLEGRAWLLLVTRRDVDGGFIPGPGGRISRLRLGPLDPAAALTFVQAAVDDHPLTAAAVDTLAVRSGGNPLFLEALVLEASRSGSLTELPESVEGLVTSAIDRLDPEARRVLRYAAVLGTTVDEEVLDVLLDGTDGIRIAGRLSDFLVRERPGRLRFRNGLLRDVAYEGLPFSRRRLLHEQVGETIEGTARSPEEQAELLSQHFFQAGRPEKAWHYSVLAGERALSKFAHREAVDHLARAAQSAPRAGSVAAEELGRVLELLADSRFLIGLTQEAASTYAQARRRIARDPVRLAAIIEKEARIEHRHRKYTQAMRRISRGLHALEGVPGRPAGIARSLLARRYAFSRFNQGRIDEALHWANLAASSAEEAVDKDALAQAYEMLNAIYAGSGREEPLPYGRLALLAYRELGNLPRQGHCLNNLAVQAFTHGRWSDALVDYGTATEIFRRIGDTASEGNALFNRCELLVRQGRESEAGELLPGVLRIARAVEDDELVALALREQGRVRAAAGDVDGACRVLREVRDLFLGMGEPSEVTTTDLARAEVLLSVGRLDDVHEVLDALTAETDPAADALSLSAYRVIGLLHAAEGSDEEATATLTHGLELAQQEGDRYEEGLLLHALAEIVQAPAGPLAGELRRSSEAILVPMGVARLNPR
jgi:tetratricopeptide (TPR) repeat protein